MQRNINSIPKSIQSSSWSSSCSRRSCYLQNANANGLLKLKGCGYQRRGVHSSSSSRFASASASASAVAASGSATPVPSALKNPTFTSFFFHNAQWSSGGSGSASDGLRRKSLRTSIEDLAYRPSSSSSSSPPSSSPTTEDATSLAQAGYKPISKPTGLKLLKVYNQLAKSNLTVLVVLTSMSSVALSPFPATIPVLLSTALGTVLCSASANTFNQLQEIPFDAQMARTRNRPFVRRAITPLHGVVFGVGTGVLGTGVLWAMTNGVTAGLGLANVVLYAGVYTWMKRRSVWNTWVGAVVGGIPPLMGWTACGGRLWPETWSWDSFPLFLPEWVSSHLVNVNGVPIPSVIPSLETLDNPLAPLALFTLLFSWQFFHFMPLSHLVRQSYAQAGYKMLSVLDTKKNALVALRHTLLLLPVCGVLFPISGLTTWWFAATSLVPNLICARGAWRFWRRGGEKEARVVFQQSLWYLPVVMGLMMFHKQGMEWLEWLGIVEKDDEDEQKRGGLDNDIDKVD